MKFTLKRDFCVLSARTQCCAMEEMLEVGHDSALTT